MRVSETAKRRKGLVLIAVLLRSVTASGKGREGKETRLIREGIKRET